MTKKQLEEEDTNYIFVDIIVIVFQDIFAVVFVVFVVFLVAVIILRDIITGFFVLPLGSYLTKEIWVRKQQIHMANTVL